jgi:hypothetical protein
MNTNSAARLFKRLRMIPGSRYVLHGSPTRSSILLPRRPNAFTLQKSWRNKAVYATSFITLAVFYAVIRDPRWLCERKKEFCLLVPKEGYDLSPGYIHVCPRQPFRGGTLVARAERPVRPTMIISVPPDFLAYLGDLDEFSPKAL